MLDIDGVLLSSWHTRLAPRALELINHATMQNYHAAFDNNIIGISPDYTIKVREDILLETDGPMLKHGIQKLNNQQIILPVREKDRPDKKRLEERYTSFTSK